MIDQAEWAALGAALISDCLGRFQAMHAAIAPRTGRAVVGPAFTVRTMAGENSTIHRALTHAPAGCVLVVDAEGHVDRAVWGEILTAAAQAVGVVGAVVDGATRDLAGIRARDFPLFARGVCPAGPHKGWRGDIGGGIQCGGVVVNPGDLVVGDEDGVVVVPAERLDETLAAARARAAQERAWTARIEGGETSVEVLGLQM